METILLIDDDVTVHDVLAEVLSQDYQIIDAYDGKDGIKKFIKNREQIALVLLDMTMPDKTGLDVLAEFSELGLGKIPVIMLTSVNENEVESACIEAGAIDYIRKPINVRVLKARLTAHMPETKGAEMLEGEIDSAIQILMALKEKVRNIYF